MIAVYTRIHPTDAHKKNKMANVQNNHELTVILTKEEGPEGSQELLEQSSEQLDSGTAGFDHSPPEVSGSCLTTNSSSEAPMLTLSPVRKESIAADNAARNRSPVQYWQHSTINLHNVR